MSRTVVFAEAPDEVVDWLERRRALGQDGHDEMWEGEYYVPPMAHGRQGDVGSQLGELLGPRARRVGLRPIGAVNIGVSNDNFRVPNLTFIRGRDLVVYFPTAAIVVEVVSPNDRSYATFTFYFDRGVEEVLIADPQLQTVQWHTRGPGCFERTGASVLLDVDEATLHGEIDWPPA
jgi:Uma2 family endonuclease